MVSPAQTFRNRNPISPPQAPLGCSLRPNTFPRLDIRPLLQTNHDSKPTTQLKSSIFATQILRLRPDHAEFILDNHYLVRDFSDDLARLAADTEVEQVIVVVARRLYTYIRMAGEVLSMSSLHSRVTICLSFFILFWSVIFG
ncbi:hypothetical protein BDV28DRAFT_60190 [Aspergillus coremiiformis]|uniref:Uncharacterized protein n=1 Tax=Aspergillus coremiiformis TaxID=138285 RepID=A0A5N6ZD31_9EURO|nr:hypothetical protein BDV28DRAFT_60190 [Aspergillus coremiiformis]